VEITFFYNENKRKETPYSFGCLPPSRPKKAYQLEKNAVTTITVKSALADGFKAELP
jgi:hypothetical protein